MRLQIHCTATLNYLTDELPVPTRVEIRNGREASDLSWTGSGFELREHASVVEDWTKVDADWTHYDEIGDLARELTGCDAVLYYPALLRSPESARASADLAPIEFIHSDYTESYRSMIEDGSHAYRAILAPFMERADITGDDIVAARRVLTLQFWRNVGAPRPSHPLAFCDARTVERASLSPILVAEYGGIPTNFESFSVAPPPEEGGHAWYTFPEMRPDEVVVFRAYDSERAEAGEPFWTPHSAFVDATAGPDAPARTSVEMRAICLFT